MLPPKTSHHAKFCRDRSNQLGDRGWSEKKFPQKKNFHLQTVRLSVGALLFEPFDLDFWREGRP